ncbi:MAG: SDR family NAD(P)-dependent oxidoreductase [Alphaproteobacteria bacterium]|nr:SDR family NAD(P)-dependent oxidoreductase [Alphaproteobacteria bacterium]
MTVLVTGAAGFIGMSVSHALMDRGERVLGVDNLNDYYDVTLKEARLASLQKRNAFSFAKADIADEDALDAAVADFADIDRVVHLAAQAGVRYSLENPRAYIRANISGHLNLLEFARARPALKHLVYASSSSVYGGNTKLPFSVDDSVDHPVSLYAATKKSDELMSQAYAHLYRTPMTGLRFFTVYGPWGRPDMSAFIFAKKILAGEPIPVFNNGEMQRDFTYIDDIVAGVLAALDRPPNAEDDAEAPHRVYNLGNNKPEPLMGMIAKLEAALGKKAMIDFQPMQPGDVPATYADIEASRRDLGFEPRTGLEQGLSRFADWFRTYHGA